MIDPMQPAKTSTAWFIFAGVFLVSLAVQSHFWYGFGFADGRMWSATATAYQQGHAWNASPATVTQTALIYPATTIFMPASVLIALGLAPDHALELAIAFLLSLISAAVAYFAYELRPHRWWWLALSALLLTDRLYQSATLASAVMVPFAVLFIVLCIRAYEFPEKRWSVIALGIGNGLMLATRLDISLALSASAALLLLSDRRYRDAGIMTAVSTATFIVAGPFWILSPAEYVSLYAAMMRFAPTLHTAITWGSFFDASGPYMSLAGILIGSLVTMFPGSIPPPLPPKLFWWLVLVTSAISSALLLSQGWQTRYFYPLYAIWDAIFILFVLEIIHGLALPKRLELLKNRVLPLLLVVIVIAAQMPESLPYTFLASLFRFR